MNADEEKFIEELMAENKKLKNALNEIIHARDIFCLSDAQFVAEQALKNTTDYE